MPAGQDFRTLEFDRVLRALGGCAQSELTRALIEDIEVVFHPARIDENLDQTEEALRFAYEHPAIEAPGFAALEDLSPLWQRLAAGELADSAAARSLTRYFKLCAEFDQYSRHLGLASYPRLADLAHPWQSVEHLRALTNRIFSEEGEVRDNASSTLLAIRASLRKFEGEVRVLVKDLLKEVKDGTGDDAIVTIRNHRFVVLIPRHYAGSVKGSVVDFSGTGQSVYYEPAALGKLNVERQHLFLEEDQEVRRILREYSERLSSEIPVLQSNLSILARFDFVLARGRYAGQLKAHRPAMTREGGFILRGAVHPLLWKDFVSEDLSFDGEKALIISGVNAGGKTVLLKLLGLYSLMAAIGCFVPGDAQLPYLSGVCAYIGDEQSTLYHLSTFTAHLRFIKELWAQIDANGPGSLPVLVLIDEIGTGTEPGEGGAFAYGLLSSLLEQPVLLAVTTHFDVLKTMAYEYPGKVKNVCLQFDREKLKATYRVLDNQPGQSYALAIAESFGIDPRIVERAKAALGQEERKMASVIAELEQAREEAVDTRAAIRQQADELARVRSENDKLLAELKEAKHKFALHADSMKADMKRRIEEMLEETKRKLKNKAKRVTRKDTEYVSAASKTSAMVRQQEAQAEEALEAMLAELEIENDPLAAAQAVEALNIGDRVVLEGSRLQGEVLEFNAGKGEAVVSVMGKRMSVKLSALRRLDPASQKKADPLAAFRKGAQKAEAARELPESLRASIFGRKAALDPAASDGAAKPAESKSKPEAGKAKARPASESGPVVLGIEDSFSRGLQDSSNTLDLHGQHLEQAEQLLNEFMDRALVNGLDTIRVMHGVGTGRLRNFVQDYLKRNKHAANVRFAPLNEGGVGVTMADLR
ncbi:Smr/MutS family protein [bacterium]|nr:Smr/MutS family protein [bacterium]